MQEPADEEVVEGTGERVDLDTPSKFTLTRFRHSKYTRLFLWIISLMGLGTPS